MASFSIITVTLNSARHIRRAIESVLAQSDDDLEYIVVDGKSSDGTVAIVEEYRNAFGDRLVVLSERDSGLYDAMNKGIGLATGDIIGILNSDDEYLSGALEVIRGAFAAKEIDIVFANVLAGDEGDAELLRGTLSGIREWMSLPHPGCFVRRSAYCKWGTFDTRLRIAADYDFILRCYLGGAQFRHADHPAARFSPGGASSKTFRLAAEMYRIHARQISWPHALRCFLKRICIGTFFEVRRFVGTALLGHSRYDAFRRRRRATMRKNA